MCLVIELVSNLEGDLLGGILLFQLKHMMPLFVVPWYIGRCSTAIVYIYADNLRNFNCNLTGSK